MTSFSNTPLKTLIALIIVAVACLILSVCIIVLTVTLVKLNAPNPSPVPSFTNWRQRAANPGSCPKNWDPLPLLLISLDGFRADYLLRHRTSAIQTLIDNGVHAPYMYPSYPSITFPNHYSIVTGLYPQSHGIIDNNMFDASITPATDQYFALGRNSSFNPEWWKGEPMWNTMTKNGKKSATYFWPGSDVKINGELPTYWKKYNSSVPFEDRVETIIEWLELSIDKRPDFLTLYFNQPDHNGHKYGPFSTQVNDELLVVDSLIDSLMTRLFNAGLFDCLNLVIISDHGMSQIVRNITVDSYYDQLDNTNTSRFFKGPVGRILLTPGAGGPNSSEIVEKLKCRDPQYRVYAKKDIPKRLHYTKSIRIGDVIVDSDEGCMVFRNNKTAYPTEGGHGFDYRDYSMHALFLAHGPSFKRAYSILPFQNIELYNLFADVMKLQNRANNDGTPSSLQHMLSSNARPTVPVTVSLPSCPVHASNFTKCGACAPLNLIPMCSISLSVAVSSENGRLGCHVTTCPWSSVFDPSLAQSRLVSAIINPRDKYVHVARSTCSLIDPLYSNCAQLKTNQSQLSFRNISYYPLIRFKPQGAAIPSVNIYVQAPMYDSFYTGAWRWLQALTAKYTQRYGKLIVYSGPIFDYDLDDAADNNTVIARNTLSSSGVPLATHFYSILVRCDSMWNKGGWWVCVDGGSLHVLSFILPHKSNISNCQDASSYLFMHTARVNDIQRLTGFVFFNDQNVYDSTNAIRLRTHVNDKLWV